MSPWIYFIVGAVVGGCLGVMVVAMLTMSHKTEEKKA